MDSSIFLQFGIVLVVAVMVATLMKLLRQPLIIGYILTGILVGPQVFGFLHEGETSSLLSRFGIALLLFIIGIGLNPKVIKVVGRVALVTGLGQIFFTTSIGYLLARALDFGATDAFYIAFGLAFSSTIVALKIISDKRESNQLYAKIVTGFLLVQDIIATLLLILVTSEGSQGSTGSQLLQTGAFSLLLASGLYAASAYLLPRLERFISASQEYLFLFAIAWGFGIASLFSVVGLSIEVGALFAGVALASQPYAQEVTSRLRPLRDFFLMLFFIILGAGLALDQFAGNLLPVVIGLSLFVLIGNPFVIMTLMGLLGYTKKTSFKSSLTVSQIGEFSLIFVLLGATLGKIDERIVSVVTMVMLITIAISAYLMLFDERIYRWFERYLSLFERKKVKVEQKTLHDAEVLLFGYRRGGQELIPALQKLGKPFLIVDYDPVAVDTLKQEKLPFAYGDANDVEFLQEIGISSARLVISMLADFKTNLLITTEAHARNPMAIIIVHGEHPEDALQLYEYGATYVMMPRYIGSERVGQMINRTGLKKSDFEQAREKHLRFVSRHLT